ncbi:MAG: twin-arginine translocase subunit TatC [Chloroflexi bacterium]|nr:twin-arginine translocase subunit TatC [Chloroflexota bacterium]
MTSSPPSEEPSRTLSRDEAATMSLVEHLDELRSRIIVIAISVVVAGVIGFFLAEPIIGLLRAPLPDHHDRLVQLGIGESLGVRLRVALYVGIALSVPVILYQLWRFVTPGLTRHERRFVWPLLIGAIALFALGIGLGYVVIPYAVQFLLSLTLPGVDPLLRLSDYVNFVLTVMLAFGLAFQFPIVLLLLARVGILSYGFLSRRRRWAVLFIVLFAVVVTPGGDPLSSAVLSLVMYALFESTLQIMRSIDDDALRLVHDPDYVTLLAVADVRGGWLDPDTYVVPGSLRAARLAAGATVQAARAAASGEAVVAFAVVRPPGHHADVARASGFCLLNNAALAVAVLRAEGLAHRTAIVDWDVHHGDGTQAIFYADPDVCYASTHQSPFYPGTGSAAERGSGEAEGTTHNRPLTAGAGDAEFVAAWRDDLLPSIEAFKPDAILVSAGYDAHRDDPLAHLAVTAEGFGAVSRLVGAMAARLGLPGVTVVLEGGYDLAALRGSAAATVRGLLEGRSAPSSA